LEQKNNKSLSSNNSDRWMGIFINVFPFVGLLIVIIGFSIFSSGATIRLSNSIEVFNQSFALLLVTAAALFLLSQDCLDMSIGATIGMAGAVAAYISKTSIPIAFISAIAVGLLIGLTNGFLHGVLGINAMIATLAMQFILRGLLLIVCQSGTIGIAIGMYALDNTALKFVICAAFMVVCYLFFQYHIYGKQCKAIGAGKTATIQSGVNVTRVKVIGYAFMGATAGLAGFFTVIRTGAAMYNTGNMVEFDVLIALILGGMPINGGADSHFRSAIIGALILGVLNNGMIMLGLGTYPQLITKGLIFIFVLALTFTMRYQLNKNKRL